MYIWEKEGRKNGGISALFIAIWYGRFICRYIHIWKQRVHATETQQFSSTNYIHTRMYNMYILFGLLLYSYVKFKVFWILHRLLHFYCLLAYSITFTIFQPAKLMWYRQIFTYTQPTHPPNHPPNHPPTHPPTHIRTHEYMNTQNRGKSIRNYV